MKLVYIEDDLDDIEHFYEAVKKCDPTYECFAACDGTRGVEMLEEMETPDFIFLDIRLPGLTGKEILMILRRDPRYASVPIIMTSVSMLPTDVKELLKCGADQCMTKPEHMEELCDKLKTIIRTVKR